MKKQQSEWEEKKRMEMEKANTRVLQLAHAVEKKQTQMILQARLVFFSFFVFVCVLN